MKKYVKHTPDNVRKDLGLPKQFYNVWPYFYDNVQDIVCNFNIITELDLKRLEKEYDLAYAAWVNDGTTGYKMAHFQLFDKNGNHVWGDLKEYLGEEVIEEKQDLINDFNNLEDKTKQVLISMIETLNLNSTKFSKYWSYKSILRSLNIKNNDSNYHSLTAHHSKILRKNLLDVKTKRIKAIKKFSYKVPKELSDLIKEALTPKDLAFTKKSKLEEKTPRTKQYKKVVVKEEKSNKMIVLCLVVGLLLGLLLSGVFL